MGIEEFISLKVHNQNESMLVGVLNMEEAMVPTTYVKQETQPMLNVEMKVRSKSCLKYRTVTGLNYVLTTCRNTTASRIVAEVTPSASALKTSWMRSS